MLKIILPDCVKDGEAKGTVVLQNGIPIEDVHSINITLYPGSIEAEVTIAARKDGDLVVDDGEVKTETTYRQKAAIFMDKGLICQ